MSKPSETIEHPLPTHSHRYDSFWQPKTFEEIALEQGVQPVKDFDALLGGWPEEDIDDGFEETVRHWRHEQSTATTH
jgi:hypothetical protein